MKDNYKMCEEYDIRFKIISKKNRNVYCEGIATIPYEECDAEEIEYQYWTPNGYQKNEFFFHDEEEITGLTDFQDWEIEQFKSDILEDALFINSAIETSDFDENRTYVRKNCILIINDGAEFIVKSEDYNSSNFDSNYYMKFTLFFNGKIVNISNNCFWMDPFTYEEYEVSDILYDGGYVVEVPKCIWEDPEEIEMNNDIIKEINDSFEYAYASSLVRDMGIYGTAYNMAKEKKEDSSEKELDNIARTIEEFFEEKKVKELFIMSEEDIETEIKENIFYD